MTLNRRDYYSAIPQLEESITSLNKYIKVSEGEIQVQIEDLYDNVSTITLTAEAIEERVEDAEGNITTLTETAEGLDTEISTKRRVFTFTPTVPYDVGDLWVQGDEGDIYYCITAKTDEQSYSASDWDLASKYTDDTTALLEVTNRTTLIRDKDGGTITAYVGQTYGVYTNASGSVDIVTLSWDSDGNPTVTGTIVSYGDSISFDDSLEFTIGNESSYLKWYDSDNDNVADSLAIIVDSLYIGSSEAIKNGDNVSALANDGTYATGVMRSITTTTRSVDYSTALTYVDTNPDTWGNTTDIGGGEWDVGDFVKIPLTITDRDNASAYIMCRIIDYDGSTVSTYNLSLEMDAPASKYVTEISGYDGVTVHDADDTSNFAQVTSSGLNVYVSGTQVASFGSTVTLGLPSEDNPLVFTWGYNTYFGSNQRTGHMAGKCAFTSETRFVDYSSAQAGFDVYSTADGTTVYMGSDGLGGFGAGGSETFSIQEGGELFGVYFDSNTGEGFMVMNEHSSAIGTILSANGTKSLSSGTTYTSTGVYLELTEGTWIVTARSQFEGDTTGRRAVALYTGTSTDSLTINEHARSVIPASVSAELYTQVCMPIECSATTYVYVYEFQNSGSKLSSTVYLDAIRIL